MCKKSHQNEKRKKTRDQILELVANWLNAIFSYSCFKKPVKLSITYYFSNLIHLHENRASKVKQHIFLLKLSGKLFSDYREEILLNNYFLVLVCCETLHKYLNENIKVQVIFGFCYKTMSFRDLSRFQAIALETSRKNPQHLENVLSIFHTKLSTFIRVNKVAMKINNPLSAFC